MFSCSTVRAVSCQLALFSSEPLVSPGNTMTDSSQQNRSLSDRSEHFLIFYLLLNWSYVSYLFKWMWRLSCTKWSQSRVQVLHIRCSCCRFSTDFRQMRLEDYYKSSDSTLLESVQRLGIELSRSISGSAAREQHLWAIGREGHSRRGLVASNNLVRGRGTARVVWELHASCWDHWVCNKRLSDDIVCIVI